VDDALRPAVMVLNLAGKGSSRAASSSSDAAADGAGMLGHDRDVSSSNSSSGAGVLRRMEVLPQLSSLLLQQLTSPMQTQQQQQQQQHVAEAQGSDSSITSSSTSTDVVALLQSLSVLHSSGSLGSAAPATVAALTEYVAVPGCSLSQLSALLAACAALGHPLRSSWLSEFVAAALQRLQEEQAAAAAAAATPTAAAAGGGGGVVGGAGSAFGGVLATLLDGLSL
jgi:hypothetical protein